MTPFQKVRTGDRVLDTVQDNVENSLRPIIASAILGGREIGPLSFTAGVSQRVAHGLSKRSALVKFIVVSPQGVGHVYGSESPDDRVLELTSDADLTCSLWVY